MRQAFVWVFALCGLCWAQATGPTAQPDAIREKLDLAIAQYEQAQAAAKDEALKAYDREIDAATKKGDLDGVLKLKKARESFDADCKWDVLARGSLERAKIQWEAAINRSTAAVTQAFDQAISDYTRAGNLDEAVTVRAERETIGGPGKRVVNLLTMIDPDKDAIKGTWSKGKNGLRCNASEAASLRARYQPPEEYDYVVEFTREQGSDSVVQILCRGERSWIWSMGAMGNSMCSFKDVAGADASKKVLGVIRNGQRCRALVKVRNDRISAFVGDKLIVEHKTDFSDLSIHPWYKGGEGLGVGSYRNVIVFHVIKVIEVTGRGKEVPRE